MSPGKQAEQLRNGGGQCPISPGSKELLGPGTECRPSPQGEDTQTHRGVIRALLPHDSRLTAHTLVPKATVSVPLPVPQGPAARHAHCAKTPPWPGVQT